MEVRDTRFLSFSLYRDRFFGKFELFYVSTHTFGHKTMCRDKINLYL